MTDTNTSRAAYDTEPEVTGWTGWIAYASFMMFLVGSFQVVQGIVAIFNDDYYAVAPSGLVVNIDYTAWGWTHLLLGLLLIASGVGVLTGNIAARTVGVLLALLSAVVNMLFIEAYPFWSIMIITIDVLVIWALTAHGRELKSSSF
jgi:hypothetical protein